MTTSPLSPSKKEQRNIVGLFKSGSRKVKNVKTAWKRASDEPPKRDSGVSQTSGSRNSKSDYLPEAPLQVSEIRDAEFDADKSWETRDERYSIGSEIEWAHNSGGQGAAELANYYRKVIGQHPFEIELTIERERRGKEVAEKEKLAREEQEAIVAKAIEEAILEKKRREWNERKLADEKARQTEEQERASRAMAAKQRRELTQTRFKQMATKTAEARKRESNSSAITTWSRVIGSKCGQEVGGGRIDIANGRLNTKFPTQRTVAPSVCSLASGLTTSRRPARDDVAQRSKSSAFSTPLPTGERQEQSSVQSVTLTPQELHDVAGRLAREARKASSTIRRGE
jgi:hypothetical protein